MSFLRGAVIRFCLIVAPVAFIAFHAGLAEAATKLRTGYYQNHPLVFRDENGLPQGLTVDILRAAALRLNWEPEFSFGAFGELLERLAAGELDLVVAVAETPEREDLFNFSKQSIFQNWGRVYEKPGAGVSSVLDLQGKRVAGERLDVYYVALSNLAAEFGVNFAPVPEPEYREAFGAARDGRADAAVVSRLFGELNARAYGLTPTAIVFAPSEVRYAFSNDSPQALREGLDALLVNWKADVGSPYHAALQKWFGVGRQEAESPFRRVEVQVGLIVVSLCALLLTAYFLNAFRSKTRELTGTFGLLTRTSDEQARTQAALDACRADNRALLREVHHRVKNNLQIMASLVSLRVNPGSDEASRLWLRELKASILAMGMAHDALYAGERLGRVRVAPFLRGLTAELTRAFPGVSSRISLACDCPDSNGDEGGPAGPEVDVDLAVALGITAAELVRNAFVHAFNEQEKGAVVIRFSEDAARTDEPRVLLSVEDDGAGLPDGVDPHAPQRIGFHLVVMLLRQIGGTMTVRRKGPTVISISAPLRAAPTRP